MRLRTLSVLFRIGAEHLVGELFLLIGHRVVQVLESRDELLHPLRMLLGELLIGLHVLHRGHCLELLSALYERLVHITRVLAHHIGKLAPLRLLGRGNAQLRMQLFDAPLDALGGVLASHRMAGNWGR